MCKLREGLGGYVPRSGTLPPFGLTLHDLGELIRRAGRECGLIVETEYCVSPIGNRWIDWVWLSPEPPHAPLAAFEIEGPGVPLKSLQADERRFERCCAPINILVLYQVDHDRTRRDPRTRNAVERAKAMLMRSDVRVLRDEDLFRDGGIEQVQTEAVLHRRLP